ncbi:MAG: isopentenyl-diphosphate Delta-isomerase [Pseudomonadota bacterium]
MSKSDEYDPISLPGAVSFSSEELVLVDEDDLEVGYASKLLAHQGEGQRHRAFSVFLFDQQQRLLLHRRSAHKPLWPGYWTNSCCSHPRRGEELESSVRRRLGEELGCKAEALTRVCAFEYHATYEDRGSEHELCHVFLARLADDVSVHAHPLEIAELAWCNVFSVDAMMKEERRDLTPWFRQEWALLRGAYSDEFENWLLIQEARGAAPACDDNALAFS